MDDERIEELLIAVSAGDRVAFKALFDEAAPGMAARLAFGGVPDLQAEAAICETFSEVWQGDYTVPLRPGQSLGDWLGALAESHAPPRNGSAAQPVTITPDLWRRVTRQAFPESWRNILKRSDVLFLILGAVVWAVILRLVTP